MASAFRAIKAFSRRHPISRGMLTYAILWPSSNLTQQTFLNKKSQPYDFAETARYGLFGGFYIAPTIYCWVKILIYLVPGNSIQSSIGKALIEQILYAPFAITSFLFGMSVLEGKSWEYMKLEWKQKFVSTYKTGFCIWPLVQTINFAFVKERNRVPVLGAVSFFWTIYLSYVKHLELKRSQNQMQIIK